MINGEVLWRLGEKMGVGFGGFEWDGFFYGSKGCFWRFGDFGLD